MKNISFYNYPSLYLKQKKIYNKVISRNLSNGQYILGNDLKKLEDKLAQYFQVKYCVGLADGTNSLGLGLMSLNYPKNSEIIVPSHTFVATLNAILNSGYKPVIIDINKFGKISSENILPAISKKTKAILAVNLNGEACDYDDLNKISSKYSIDLIEDNAQGFGAYFNNKILGSFGKFASLSFYPTKILGCFGDGGALITNNYEIYKKVCVLRNHGRNTKNKIVNWGTNCRLDNLQASILLQNLKNIKKKISKRRHIAKLYYEYLKKNDNILLPQTNYNHYCTFQNFEILIKHRNKLKKFLLAHGIETLIQWKGVTLNKLNLSNLKKIGSYVNTKYYFNHCICLPINESLSDNDIKYISNKINYFYNKL